MPDQGRRKELKMKLSAWDCKPLPLDEANGVYLRLYGARGDICVCACSKDGQLLESGYILGINRAGHVTRFRGVCVSGIETSGNAQQIIEVSEDVYCNEIYENSTF